MYKHCEEYVFKAFQEVNLATDGRVEYMKEN